MQKFNMHEFTLLLKLSNFLYNHLILQNRFVLSFTFKDHQLVLKFFHILSISISLSSIYSANDVLQNIEDTKTGFP